MKTDAAEYRVAIVKYDDLLQNPEDVMNYLQRLGLGRRNKPFEAAWHSQDIYSDPKRFGAAVRAIIIITIITIIILFIIRCSSARPSLSSSSSKAAACQ